MTVAVRAESAEMVAAVMGPEVAPGVAARVAVLLAAAEPVVKMVAETGEVDTAAALEVAETAAVATVVASRQWQREPTP